MFLKSALEQLTNPFFTSRSMVKRSRLEVSVKNAFDNSDEFELSRPKRSVLVNDYTLALKVNKNLNEWENVTKKSLRNFSWMLLTSIDSEKKSLVEVNNFFKQYTNVLNRRKYINGWLTLYFSILMDYPFENPHFLYVTKVLKEMLRNGQTQKAKRIWERCRQFGLLEDNAPELIVNHLNNKNTLDEIFQRIGLIGNLLNSRFCEQVYFKFLEQSADNLSKNNLQFATVKKIISESLSITGDIKYPKFNSTLIESLLTPFAVVNVEKRTKQIIKHFILKNFNDPRIRKDKWNGVESHAVSIFLAWMVDDTLRDFFTIWKFSSQDHSYDWNWKSRRAFYKSYLDINAISEAWIVLGKDGGDLHKHFCIPSMRYGRFFLNSNKEPDFSALIIRIGNIIIVEWSCVEKYRVWSQSSTDCPIFYNISYHHNELTYSPTFESNHNGNARGEWQDELSNYIKNSTGIALIFHEYL